MSGRGDARKGKASDELDRQHRKRKEPDDGKTDRTDLTKIARRTSPGLERFIAMREESARLEQLNQQAGSSAGGTATRHQEGSRQLPDSPSDSGDRTPRPGEDHIVVDTPSDASRDQTPRPGDQQGELPSFEDYRKFESLQKQVRMTKRVLDLEEDQKIETYLQQIDQQGDQQINQQIESSMQNFRKQGLAMHKLNKLEPSFIEPWKRRVSRDTKEMGPTMRNFSRNTRKSILILDDYIERRTAGQPQIHTNEHVLDALKLFESSLRALHEKYAKTQSENTLPSRKAFYELISEDIKKLDNISKSYDSEAYDNELKAKATNLRGKQ